MLRAANLFVLPYAHWAKPIVSRAFLAPSPEPIIRFETPPGHQLQIDFTTIRRGKRPLKAFVATLGYSRATFVKFFDNERARAWQQGLKEAF